MREPRSKTCRKGSSRWYPDSLTGGGGVGTYSNPKIFMAETMAVSSCMLITFTGPCLYIYRALAS